MFNFDINEVVIKPYNVIVYNSFKDDFDRAFANIFRDSYNVVTGLGGDRTGVSWLDCEASIVSTLQKLFYWFKSTNNVRVKYLLIHPKLKQFIDVNNVQMIEQGAKLRKWYKEADTIPCNKVVIVSEENICAVITVFEEVDIDKLG